MGFLPNIIYGLLPSTLIQIQTWIFFLTNDNQDGRQNGRHLSVCIHRGHSYLVIFDWISSKFHIWVASIKVIQDPCQKITEFFFFVFFFKVIFIYCLKTYKYWRSQKNIIYQHICINKYILTVWSSFTLRCVPSYTGQAILVRKLNSHAYSMYVLIADTVSCPMTQHFNACDSQISNPSIPSLAIYELSHCASKSIIFVNMMS